MEAHALEVRSIGEAGKDRSQGAGVWAMRPKWDAQNQGLKADPGAAQGQGLTVGADSRSDRNAAEGRETSPNPACLRPDMMMGASLLRVVSA